MFTRIFCMMLIVCVLLAGCGKATGTPEPSAPAAASATAPKPTDTKTPAGSGTAVSGTISALTYPIVDSGQGKCYDNHAQVPCPVDGAFFGQDAQYSGLNPAYSKNDDGTVSDKNTGLIWQGSPDTDGNGKINAADKLSYTAAKAYCGKLGLAGASDWRLPDIKTLAALLDFRGTDPGGASGVVDLIPFLDNAAFGFAYGDTAAGERTIDAQFISGSQYVDNTANDGGKVFGVNFAEGSIKGYGLVRPGGAEMKFFVLCVRGNSAYGANQFKDNGDGTISDEATGLLWQKADSASGLDWQAALAYCEGLSLAGNDDWRLPDAKSLHSLVDTTRSPATSNSAAIDALFSATSIKNEAGQPDYPSYWSSTTHVDWEGKGAQAVYVAFGRALGFVNGKWVDVHGAGALRSDPKTGKAADYPTGLAPQGEAVRILNYARCVRGGNVTATPDGNPKATRYAMPVDVTEMVPTVAGGAGGGGSEGGGGPPSKEAIAACQGKPVGAACHYSTPLGDINGTCQEFSIPGMQKVAACVPSLP